MVYSYSGQENTAYTVRQANDKQRKKLKKQLAKLVRT
jgi:hypothetical protein